MVENPVDERKRAEDGLRESQERLQLALDASGFGTFLWYPEEDRTEADERMLALFGLEPGAAITLRDALETLLDPDERARFAEAVARALDPTGDGVLAEEVRFRRPDGTAWVAAVTGRVHFDAARPVRMAGVIADVTERKRAEERLRRAAKLEREFVANAAHELRTPLTAIIAAVEALALGAKDVPVQRDRFLGHLQREATRLARLCDSLLLLAHVDSTPDLPKSAVPVRALLDEVAADIRPQPTVSVNVDAPDDLSVVTNRGLAERVVTNLAENAAKHTERGRIQLRAYPADGTIVIEVRDTGRGIEAVSGRAFERFYRAGPRTSEGFGLGLSIARQATSAIGGELSLEPSDEGGTVARLSLPRDGA